MMRRLAALFLTMILMTPMARGQETAPSLAGPPAIAVARLNYGHEAADVPFSDAFLTQLKQDTHIKALDHLVPVKIDSPQLREHPFAIMTGQGSFTLTLAQRDHLQHYLQQGGFLLASAHCSNKAWSASFRDVMTTLFPEQALTDLTIDHPVFHSVYEIVTSQHEKRRQEQLPHLQSLTLDGRVVVIFSPEGLNDAADTCCCAGREVKGAHQLNINILAYGLTQ